MKKRIISLLLCLVMVVGLLPVTAYADVNMDTYAGKRITHIEVEASLSTESAYIPEGVTADSDVFQASRDIVKVGDPLGYFTQHMIVFTPTSYTYTDQTAAGSPSVTVNNSGATELLEVTTSYLQWKNSDEKWVGSAAGQMTNYLAGQYRYLFNVSVDESKVTDANEYRIVPKVTVAVNWKNHDEPETLAVNEKFVFNHDNTSHSYASFTTAEFAAKEDTDLKLVAAGSIPSGYANEAIKPFSVTSWVSGGTKPYTFSKVSGPEGITVSEDGIVSGAPTAACETEQELTIKVTDSTGTERAATIKVAPVKTARTVIQSIELARLDYPRVGDVVPQTPNVYISKINGGAVSTDDCPLYLTISRQWEGEDGKDIYGTNADYETDKKFETGKRYRFSVQVRLEGKENCEKYYLPESFTATVSGWGAGIDNKMTVSDTGYMSNENYFSLFVDSALLTPNAVTGTLSGTVSYVGAHSGAVQYGHPLTANVTNLPTGVTTDDLAYQWQVKHDNYNIWYDILRCK